MLAFSTEVFKTLKFIHVMSAIVWVGGGIFVQIYATRLRRAGDADRLAHFAHDVHTIGNRVFAPASGLVTLMGITMVIYSPYVFFSETWIIIGLAGAIATFITGAFIIGPTSEKLAKSVEAEGMGAPGVQEAIRKIFTISRIDQVVLILVVLNMVFKPGAKYLS